jgi:hypothetical protein
VLETPHVILGAAIATKVVNPAVAIPLAVASHFILDKVPHWNPHIDVELKNHGIIKSKSLKIIIVDSSIALISGVAIASRVLPNHTHAATIIAACFFASLPDIIQAPYYFMQSKNILIKRWTKIQKRLQKDVSVIPGLATQAAVILAALWWISI